jgi:FtsH-binding integral membrane protein
MDAFFKAIVLIHIVAGASTLLTGPLAIFYNFRDPRKHRLVGKAFLYAMLVVVASAIVGFLKRPEAVFYQFLLGIALLVLTGIARGVRAIFMMKGGQVSRFDWAYTALSGLNGIFMLTMSAWHLKQGTMVAFPILFGVFGGMALGDSLRNWRVFRAPALLHRLDWMRLHSSTMLGAFTASTTAFTVNAAHFLPWWAQWFGPTLLLLPLQIYFGQKLKSMRDKSLKTNSID